MLKLVRHSLDIGLSPHGLALVHVNGWRLQNSRIIADEQLAHRESTCVEDVLEKLDAVLDCNNVSGMPSTITLADEWVRYFIVTPPKNARRLEDCRVAARMRFQLLFGVAPTDWTIDADWQAGRPFLACAAPNALVDGLRRLSGKHAVSATTITPLFVVAWNRWCSVLEPHSWLGVAGPTSMTLAALDHSEVCAIRTSPILPTASDGGHWLPTHLRREALRLDMKAPDKIYLCGHPIAGLDTIDSTSPEVCRLDSLTADNDGAAMSAALRLVRMGRRA